MITKALPGSRKRDILGIKGTRDLESINMMSDDKFLIKFRATEFSGKKDYWTIINKMGMI